MVPVPVPVGGGRGAQVGAAAIPSAGLVTMVMVLQSVGLDRWGAGWDFDLLYIYFILYIIYYIILL